MAWDSVSEARPVELEFGAAAAAEPVEPVEEEPVFVDYLKHCEHVKSFTYSAPNDVNT